MRGGAEAKQRRGDRRFCETNTARRVGGSEAGVRMKKWRGSERCREESETAQTRGKRDARAQGVEGERKTVERNRTRSAGDREKSILCKAAMQPLAVVHSVHLHKGDEEGGWEQRWGECG